MQKSVSEARCCCNGTLKHGASPLRPGGEQSGASGDEPLAHGGEDRPRKGGDLGMRRPDDCQNGSCGDVGGVSDSLPSERGSPVSVRRRQR